MAGSAGRVELVQFHPAYAYEDFVQGYRPRPMENGQPGFKLQGDRCCELLNLRENSPKPGTF